MATPNWTVRLDSSWATMSALLNPSIVSRRVRNNVAKATSRNGAILRKQMRAELKTSIPPVLAPLTTFIKGSSKSGVDRGALFKAITSQAINWHTAEAGVRKGTKEANYAVVFHEGARIPVTSKMRGMFAALAAVSNGQSPSSSLTGRAAELYKRRPNRGWKPLRTTTTHIKVPGRPFARQAFEDDATRRKIARNWSNAFAAAIAGKTKFVMVS